ncbi:MAG: ATP synthase subunit I [Gammaproteobacteria bacterium]|nr:ATP synthase subunit I [Gammaproteobacteria bacterium]NVK86661.1 ATP synthase subunit I [Gammaproteobacteria bacterium]
MPQDLNQQGRAAGYKLVLVQLGVVIIGATAALAWGFNASFSVFVGGLSIVIPSLLFTLRAFRHSGARAAKQVMNGFYAGEALKILSAIVLFVLVLKWLPVVAVAALCGFIGATLVQLFAPAFIATGVSNS